MSAFGVNPEDLRMSLQLQEDSRKKIRKFYVFIWKMVPSSPVLMTKYS